VKIGILKENKIQNETETYLKCGIGFFGKKGVWYS
jgi:hypothetical protein